MLKFILHQIQQFGSIDGLRNLIDTNLPRTLGDVFDNSHIFGPNITACCINILAAMVHQEPTSLAILQELDLVKKFLKLASSPLPASPEVMIFIYLFSS